jgi:hypothetical protein
MTRIERMIRNAIKAGKEDISAKLCANYEICDECPVNNVCSDTDEHNGFYGIIEEVIDYLFEEV